MAPKRHRAVYRLSTNFNNEFFYFRTTYSDDEDQIIEDRNGLDDEDLTSENKYNPTISTDISQMLRDLEHAKIN